MLDILTDKLSALSSRLGLKRRLSEANIEEAIREIRLAFIEAGVSLPAIKSFIDRVKKRVLGEEIVESVSSSQMFIKVVHDSLVQFLGGEGEAHSVKLREPTRLSHVVLCGLQGSGKTTTAAKLALRLRDKREVLLVSLDIHRPSANEQLRVLADQVKVKFYERGDEVDLKKIIKEASKHAERQALNCILWDTAGRVQIDRTMMEELKKIIKFIDPTETVLVVDAMTGQKAVSIAEEFSQAVRIDSLLFSKFDSDTRGGAVLSAKEVVGVPVRYIGIGEGIADLDEFVPARIADRILGMGDVVGLVQKAQVAMDEKKAERLSAKIGKKEFDLQDFLDQLEQLKSMGSMHSVLGMLPGMGQQLKNAPLDEGQFDRMRYVIQSMTKEERKRPFILNNNRRHRIARGSGSSILDVNQLLKRFKKAKEMMQKAANPLKMKKAMKNIMGSDFDMEMIEGWKHKVSGFK